MLNMKTNINTKQRLFSSNIKRDYILNNFKKSRAEDPSTEMAQQSKFNIIHAFERNQDSVLTVESDETAPKFIVADPASLEL